MKHWTVLLAAAVVLAGFDASAETVLYTASRVHTMPGPSIENGQVLVEDGKIVAVGRDLELPSGANVVDLPGVTLLPGFVDAYSRAGIAGGTDEFTREVTPNFSVSRALDFDDQALRHALYQGTTSLAPTPGTENVVAGFSSLVKTHGASRSTQLVKAEGSLILNLCSDPQRLNVARQRPDSIYVRQPTNRMGVVWILRATLARRPELTQGHSVFSVSRTSYDLTTLLTLSKEFGFSPVAVGGQESYKIADRLAAANVPVILGPLTTSGVRGPEETEVIRNAAGVLAKAGVTFAMSGGNLLEQARFAHRFGLAEEDAIRAITRTPAELLGAGDRLGTIAVGRDADMVALSGEPLEFTTSIRWVMVNGIIFGEQEGHDRVAQKQ